MMPFADPKRDMATSMDIKDPAQGPRAASAASMATTADVFTTVITSIHLWVKDKSFNDSNFF